MVGSNQSLGDHALCMAHTPGVWAVEGGCSSPRAALNQRSSGVGGWEVLAIADSGTLNFHYGG